MRIFDFLKDKKETGNMPKQEEREITGEMLLTELNGGYYITAQQAQEIPAVSACLEYIGNKVALLPLKLYERDDEGRINEIKNDERTRLFNIQPSEYFDAFLFKNMLAKDYMLYGSCYAYIRRDFNAVKELIYLKPGDITKIANTDALNRYVKYWVQGKPVDEFNMFAALRSSTDGAAGRGLINDNAEALKTAFAELLFEQKMIRKQGLKKGYLSVENKISDEALKDLKAKWPRIYAGETDETMVLNSGIKFNELASTPAEMQIIQAKKDNFNSICNLFGVAPSVLAGTATPETETATFETAVIPPAKAIESAANRVLLLESEKRNRFFAFDMDEGKKGSLEARFNSYEKAVINGILQPDEIREKENMPPLGLDFIKLGLQDVLYDAEEKIIYIPNMGKSLKLGGEWKGEN